MVRKIFKSCDIYYSPITILQKKKKNNFGLNQTNYTQVCILHYARKNVPRNTFNLLGEYLVL